MGNYIFYTLGATNSGPSPMLLIDLRLGVLTAQETLQVMQAIVAEFELVSADLPGVDMMRLWERIQTMINESSIYKRNIKIGTIVSDGKIGLRIDLVSKVPNKALVV